MEVPLRGGPHVFLLGEQALAEMLARLLILPDLDPDTTLVTRPCTLSPASSRGARLSSRVLRSRHPTTR